MAGLDRLTSNTGLARDIDTVTQRYADNENPQDGEEVVFHKQVAPSIQITSPAAQAANKANQMTDSFSMGCGFI